MQTVIHWFRRDLRLAENPALAAAAGQGAVVPVFIHSKGGAAQNWQVHQELGVLGDDLRAAGSKLILRKGAVFETLLALAQECGARHITCLDDPTLPALGVLSERLAAHDIRLERVSGAYLLDRPDSAAKPGGYRVFTPFWRWLESQDLSFHPLSAPQLRAPDTWPDGLPLSALGLEAGVAKGAAALRRFSDPGRAAALARMAEFAGNGLGNYAETRDAIWGEGASGLSMALALGTLSVRELWQACPAPAFRRQLAWREFAAHLWHYSPDLDTRNWSPGWAGFQWGRDAEALAAWQQGRTGVDIVDAGMRALWCMGRMPNRLRMIVASYLTKNLGQDWRAGLAWFADTLVDHDRASNAMGWQWVAGCGPDAAPYYRIFNPDLQAARHDADGAFRAYWLQGEGAAFFDAARPASWTTHRPPPPDLKAQRQAALARWQLGLGRNAA